MLPESRQSKKLLKSFKRRGHFQAVVSVSMFGNDTDSTAKFALGLFA
jgi:hypothetical protein